MTRVLDSGGGVEDGRDPAEASASPRPPYPSIAEARDALGLNAPIIPAAAAVRTAAPEPRTVNYQHIHKGMVLLEPFHHGGSARGTPLKAVRHDRKWGETGAWICRSADGKRINVWPGIAHMYTIGDRDDWNKATQNERRRTMRKARG